MIVTETRRQLSNHRPVSLMRPEAGRTALILLNWQEPVVSESGVWHERAATVGVALSEFDAAVEKAYQCLVNEVLTTCRAARIDVMHVTSDWNFLLRVPGCDPLSPWKVPFDLSVFYRNAKPIAGELVIRSTSASPFNSTRIDSLLRNLGVEQIMVSGLTTNHEVELTAADARDRGYEVVVIEDACVALSSALHEAAIGRLHAAMIPVASTSVIAEVIAQPGNWPDEILSQSTITHPIVVDDPMTRLRWPIENEWDLSRSALITVDMQYLNAHPEWGVGRIDRESKSPQLDTYFDLVRGIVPKVRRVQDFYRRRNRPLIHFRTACQRGDEQDSGRHRQRNRDPMAPLSTREADFLEEVLPLPGELILNKTSWGAFNSTEIMLMLQRLAITQLTLVGVVTNGCVEMTARDALDRGYRVTIVADATTARTTTLHEDGLHRLENCGATIITAKALAKQLAG